MKVNRRSFIKGAALSGAFSPFAKAKSQERFSGENPGSGLPRRSIGGHSISRLIIGGNPFSHIAHAEPLVYSGDLFRHYFTHEKVVETLLLSEIWGINTFLGRIDDNVVSFLRLYRKRRGKDMPWIAQTSKKPQRGATVDHIFENIKFAADNGAIGVYLQGESADYLVEQDRMSEIEQCLKFIGKLGLIAGVGAHDIGTIEACERAGLEPDFYMKTYNRLEYCCPGFDRTREVMTTMKKPWIAFKILAAGRMQSSEGFSSAVKAGADFLCVGMFDFQVAENVELAASLFAGEAPS